MKAKLKCSFPALALSANANCCDWRNEALSLRTPQQIEVRLHSRYVYCSSGWLCRAVITPLVHPFQAEKFTWSTMIQPTNSSGADPEATSGLGRARCSRLPLHKPRSAPVGTTFGPGIRLLCISERLEGSCANMQISQTAARQASVVGAATPQRGLVLQGKKKNQGRMSAEPETFH